MLGPGSICALSNPKVENMKLSPPVCNCSPVDKASVIRALGRCGRAVTSEGLKYPVDGYHACQSCFPSNNSKTINGQSSSELVILLRISFCATANVSVATQPADDPPPCTSSLKGVELMPGVTGGELRKNRVPRSLRSP